MSHLKILFFLPDIATRSAPAIPLGVALINHVVVLFVGALLLHSVIPRCYPPGPIVSSLLWKEWRLWEWRAAFVVFRRRLAIGKSKLSQLLHNLLLVDLASLLLAVHHYLIIVDVVYLDILVIDIVDSSFWCIQLFWLRLPRVLGLFISFLTRRATRLLPLFFHGLQLLDEGVNLLRFHSLRRDILLIHVFLLSFVMARASWLLLYLFRLSFVFMLVLHPGDF